MDDPCWDGYEQIGMKEKDGKQVPNCVPKSTEGGLGSGRNGHMPWMKEITELKTNKHKSGLEDMDMSEFANKNHMCKNCMNKAFASLTANESKASEFEFGDYHLGNYIYDQNYLDAVNALGGNPSDQELMTYFQQKFPEAEPSHLMADLVGVKQLMFDYHSDESKASEKMWECGNCDGTGKDEFGYCYNCKGTGQLSDEDMERQYQSDQKWKKMASQDDDYIDGSDVPKSGFYESYASEGAYSEAAPWWDQLPEHERKNLSMIADQLDGSFNKQWNELDDNEQWYVGQAYIENFIGSSAGLSEDERGDFQLETIPWDGGPGGGVQMDKYFESKEIGELDEDKEESKIAKALLDELDKELDSESLASEDTSDSSAFFTQNFNLVPTEGAGIAVCKHCGYDLDLEKFDSTVLQEHLRLDHGIAESKAKEDALNPDSKLDTFSTPFLEEEDRFRNDMDRQKPDMESKAKERVPEEVLDYVQKLDDPEWVNHGFMPSVFDIGNLSPSGVTGSGADSRHPDIGQSQADLMEDAILYGLVEDTNHPEREQYTDADMGGNWQYGTKLTPTGYDQLQQHKDGAIWESKAKEGSWDELGDNPTPEEIENYLRTHPEEVQAIDDMEIDLDKLEF